MNVFDYILLALVITALAAAVYNIAKRRASGCDSCGCGSCKGCSGCKTCNKK